MEANRSRLPSQQRQPSDRRTPNPIARSLPGHQISFARQIGWHELKNGELLRQAEAAGFDLLLTSDRNIRYQ